MESGGSSANSMAGLSLLPYSTVPTYTQSIFTSDIILDVKVCP